MADTQPLPIRSLLRAALLAGLFAACTGPRPGGSTVRAPKPAPPTEIGPEELDWLDEVRIPRALQPLEAEQEVELTYALYDLQREDFGMFSTAMRKIAEMGEPVVPYLGFVEDRDSAADPESDRSRSPTLILLKQVLRTLPPDRVGLHLESPYRSVRVAASSTVGELRQTEHAGRLVELLDDPELDVRRAAIVSLRMVSNRFYGYQPGASERKRREAAELWRKFWASAPETGTAASDQP